MKKIILVFMVSLMVVLLVGCAQTQDQTQEEQTDIIDIEKEQEQKTEENEEPEAELANPASVKCIEEGYELEMRQDENGTYGVCIFDDGSFCEEWAYFRGECKRGENYE